MQHINKTGIENKQISTTKEEAVGRPTNAEVIKQLEWDFGLGRTKIYELMSDEFKREYTKADYQFWGER